jgi:acyl-CoA reductase-like NAD-dependent aldehyde dehydrogenase
VEALLKHRDVGIILATGGEAMVRAAYSSGNPAIGVGPGNGPAFIERSADVKRAVGMIMDSKTFDNGTICASEQSVVADAPIADEVAGEFRRQGGYMMNEGESAKVGALLFAGNRMNPKIVGRPAARIAELAGIDIPSGTRVLLSRQTEVAENNPYSREKLCPVLGFYVEEGWENACRRCLEILANEGEGHTMVIHSTDERIIREFAMKKTVSRLLVNTPAALGGVGATTNLAPALTLGCGAVGKGATGDNITPLNLINIRRVAAGCRSLEELRAASAALLSPAAPVAVPGLVPPEAARPDPAAPATSGQAVSPRTPDDIPPAGRFGGQKLDAGDLEAITELVVKKLARLSGGFGGSRDGGPPGGQSGYLKGDP